MTTLPLDMEHSADSEVNFPAGWWLIPAVLGGAGIWVAGLTALFF